MNCGLRKLKDGKSVQSFAKSKTFSELEKELIKQKFAEFKK